MSVVYVGARPVRAFIPIGYHWDIVDRRGTAARRHDAVVGAECNFVCQFVLERRRLTDAAQSPCKWIDVNTTAIFPEHAVTRDELSRVRAQLELAKGIRREREVCIINIGLAPHLKERRWLDGVVRVD